MARFVVNFYCRILSVCRKFVVNPLMCFIFGLTKRRKRCQKLIFVVFYSERGFIVGNTTANNSWLFILLQILYFAWFPELHTTSYSFSSKAKLLSNCCLSSVFVVRINTENPSQKMSNLDKLLNDSCFF